MEEPGSSNEDTISEQDLEKRLFITVGTAIVDKDGEDVSSKGRVLLFELSSSQSQPVELNVVYEKKIFHGPVSSFSRRQHLTQLAETETRIIQKVALDLWS